MTRRWRIALAVIGLLIVCLSVAVLVYVFAPIDKEREQFRPSPTLFAPPQSNLFAPPPSEAAPRLAEAAHALQPCEVDYPSLPRRLDLKGLPPRSWG